MTAVVPVWLATLPVALIMMTGVWAASLPTRDASLVDRFWGLGFVVVAWACVWAGGTEVPATVLPRLTLALVALWGIRLSGYITWRNWGHGEDRRYAAMREAGGVGWAGRSLATVFWLQAALLWLLAAPLAAAILTPAVPTVWLLGAGVLAWLVGFAFEAGGDWQLARFKADPANQGQVMAEGFWRYTRHPNYFGDAMCWWGYFLLAASVGAWWTVFSPILMTFLLMRVSGVTLLERSLAETKPGYREYVARTNAFFPGPRRPQQP